MAYIFIIIALLVATILSVFCVWLYFVFYLLKSFKQSPTLMFFAGPDTTNELPKVSVIIAARNEEKYISKCLDSLIKQDYPNFEIIAIDDSSSDSTCGIMQKYQMKNCDKMVVINAGLSPNEWTGKNWACYQGYLKSTGKIFLFTDADTFCTSRTLSQAVGNLSREKLDALTVRPTIVCESRWAKIILPVLWTFSHIKYSALRVNDHKTKKCGYFFGCFYLITRQTYEGVGTHREVKNQILEDLALGEKVKQQGYKLKMYRGEHQVNTMQVGNFSIVLQGLGRGLNLIPFSRNDSTSFFLTAFLLAAPIFLLLLSTFLLTQKDDPYTAINLLSRVLLIISLMTVIIIICVSVIQSKIGICQHLAYGLASPMACLLISIMFGFFIMNQRNNVTASIKWRGRQYINHKKR
jgi:glycosyltransferase involved in cell wall biosynthesis